MATDAPNPLRSSVMKQFEQATQLLIQVRSKLAALVSAEEQQTAAAESLTETSTRLALIATELNNAASVTGEALQTTQSVLRAAEGFLSNVDISRLAKELVSTREAIEDAQRTQIATLTQERDEALAAQERFRTERDATQTSLMSEQARYQELRGRISMLPKRVQQKFG